jgi:hypothetical protein
MPHKEDRDALRLLARALHKPLDILKMGRPVRTAVCAIFATVLHVECRAAKAALVESEHGHAASGESAVCRLISCDMLDEAVQEDEVR